MVDVFVNLVVVVMFVLEAMGFSLLLGCIFSTPNCKSSEHFGGMDDNSFNNHILMG